MVTINFLWPKWADRAAHLHVKVINARGWRCWRIVHKAAALLVDCYRRDRAAALARRTAYARSFFRRAGLLAVLACLSVPSTTSANDDEESLLFRALGCASYVSFGGDAVSTELALANGAPELNPFQRNRGVRVGSHIAAPILMNYATAELYRDGHKKTALWVRVATVATFGYATAHNLRQATR